MLNKWNPDIILNRIETLLKDKHSVKIAIDGNSGAGKTTLAKYIEEHFDCNVFHMDDFFLPLELKTEERLKEVGGNVDYVRFRHEVADRLIEGGNFEYRVYNCRTLSFDRTIFVKEKRLNIVEGVYSMHPTLIDIYDYKIFLSIDHDKQLERIIKRSGAALANKFKEIWIPMENRYFSEMKIKENSDLVF
ncbi:MAG TPA: uridine kinase [Clostridiaceae bacterium]|mgnify:CR=1 FL=1|nr:uridine kinase [Clostridiaceae bacterium]